MRILHVLYSGLGGHSNVFFTMVSADEQKEFEYRALFNGVEIIRNEYIQQCNERDIKWSFLKKNKGLDINYIFQLYKTIKRSRADVIFLHSGNAVFPARMAKLFSKSIKQILVRETQANHLKSKVDWVSLSLSLLFADKIIFLTEECKKQIASKLRWIYRKDKIAVIPNGINMAVFKPLLKTDETKIVLGMQSRIVNIKDHKTLLSAFSMLLKNNDGASNLQLKIAGDGECKAELEEMTRLLGIDNHVFFVGILNEEKLVEFLNSLDIYIHASLGETMSTSIMQAMACKKPIIASDVPGINNMIIHNKTGILIPVKEPGAMAGAIENLINDRELRASLAENAFAFAKENYSGSIMFSRYNQIFTS